MSMRLTRVAYKKLIDQDLEYLKKQPRTLERDHVLVILDKAVEYEYGPLEASDEP